ncbi:MAG: septum formation initiator family protein [Actinomycetia bacterium]|nr:septum formation initiator family protein [Actinomycetes bacterium]
MIAVAALVLVVLLAPTVRSYFAQRSEISTLERQVAQSEERVAALEREEQRWRDPAYVEQQAREQLQFVRPGEVAYTVIGADEVIGQQVATGEVAEDRPWYDRVWASIGQADQTEPEIAP